MNLSTAANDSAIINQKISKKPKPSYNSKFIITSDVKKAKQELLLKSQRFKFSPVRKGVDHHKNAWERLIENTMDPNRNRNNPPATIQ